MSWRPRVACGMVAAFAVLSAQPSPAAAQSAPARSGTILGAYTVGGPAGCGWFPDCSAWLASHCDPRLAVQDPAALTAIVEVSDLAGSRRKLVRQRWLGNITEFWSGDCRWMGAVPYRDTHFTIPPGTRWLTIPTSVVPYQQWALY